ncbi:MAG: TolC family outer membrane protein [Leptothrix sp. (in: b-proteobacteria)]
MKNHFPPLLGCIALACLLTLGVSAQAQVADPLKDAAQRAITTNPEVNARLNAFRASVDEVDVAKGGFYPRLDLGGELSRTRDRFEAPRPSLSVPSTSAALTATQLLWDGLGTSSQVQRLDHSRLVRYFEFIDSSEQIALESTRAHADVVRARRLVKLAEDNYVQHRQVFDQIQSRVKAGVGRGVDQEQVAARLALAESNLATESTNLHDVTERYRRIVGLIPQDGLTLDSTLDRGLPPTAAETLAQTAKRNASVAAAIENLRAAQSQVKERDSSYQPRVEARVRAGLGNNMDRNLGQKSETSAGIFLNWNLFNGGSDQARTRQSTNLLTQAMDNRDKACRDTRQTAAIAFNDVRNLTDQVAYLDRNVSASKNTRDAYRQQFDIGQRSLLDVLNSENELFVARRALANAESDLLIAKARTHAASSSLVQVLGLSRANPGAAAEPADAPYWQAGEDAATCPISATELTLTPKADLDARARQQIGTLATPVPTSSAVPAAALPLIAAAPKLASIEPSRADPPVSTPVSQRLLDWASAWSAKDVTRYLSFYDPSFKPVGTTRDAWFKNRSKLLKKDGPIDLKINDVQRKTLSPSLVETKFEQVYESNGFKDKTLKTLQWKRVGVEWYIVKESSR